MKSVEAANLTTAVVQASQHDPLDEGIGVKENENGLEI